MAFLNRVGSAPPEEDAVTPGEAEVVSTVNDLWNLGFDPSSKPDVTLATELLIEYNSLTGTKDKGTLRMFENKLRRLSRTSQGMSVNKNFLNRVLHGTLSHNRHAKKREQQRLFDDRGFVVEDPLVRQSTNSSEEEIPSQEERKLAKKSKSHRDEDRDDVSASQTKRKRSSSRRKEDKKDKKRERSKKHKRHRRSDD